MSLASHVFGKQHVPSLELPGRAIGHRDLHPAAHNNQVLPPGRIVPLGGSVCGAPPEHQVLPRFGGNALNVGLRQARVKPRLQKNAQRGRLFDGDGAGHAGVDGTIVREDACLSEDKA